jgi:hypothetical protein
MYALVFFAHDEAIPITIGAFFFFYGLAVILFPHDGP